MCADAIEQLTVQHGGWAPPTERPCAPRVRSRDGYRPGNRRRDRRREDARTRFVSGQPAERRARNVPSATERTAGGSAVPRTDPESGTQAAGVTAAGREPPSARTAGGGRPRPGPDRGSGSRVTPTGPPAKEPRTVARPPRSRTGATRRPRAAASRSSARTTGRPRPTACRTSHERLTPNSAAKRSSSSICASVTRSRSSSEQGSQSGCRSAWCAPRPKTTPAAGCLRPASGHRADGPRRSAARHRRGPCRPGGRPAASPRCPPPGA